MSLPVLLSYTHLYDLYSGPDPGDSCVREAEQSEAATEGVGSDPAMRGFFVSGVPGRKRAAPRVRWMPP